MSSPATTEDAVFDPAPPQWAAFVPGARQLAQIAAPMAIEGLGRRAVFPGGQPRLPDQAARAAVSHDAEAVSPRYSTRSRIEQ